MLGRPLNRYYNDNTTICTGDVVSYNKRFHIVFKLNGTEGVSIWPIPDNLENIPAEKPSWSDCTHPNAKLLIKLQPLHLSLEWGSYILWLRDIINELPKLKISSTNPIRVKMLMQKMSKLTDLQLIQVEDYIDSF